MSHNSDLILELLQETDTAMSKRGIEVNLKRKGFDVSYDTIKKQAEVLADYGLLELAAEKGAWYELTEKGEAYLEGEVSHEELVA